MQTRSLNEFIDARELSRRLSISRGTVYNWVSQGRIPRDAIVHLGSRLLFRPARIAEWIEQQQGRNGKPEAA